MAVFVINEWLWADAAGDNDLDGQRRAIKVINRLATSEHRIVVLEGSRFDQKAWNLCKSGDPIVSGLVKTYLSGIRFNLDRCLLLKDDMTPALPADLALTIKDDDHYLVRTQLSVTGSVLVTTDAPLRELVIQAGLACLSREEFLVSYFGW